MLKDPIEHLLGDRLPWLFVGLIGGLLTTLIVSKYEAILAADVRLAFFIPIMVYLSDAVGTQSETIYIRLISKKRTHFARYMMKETMVGIGLGLISGAALAIIIMFWLNSFEIALTVGLAMFINMAFAPALAITIPNLLYRRHNDPALGAGPVATIIQDLLALLVFFFIANIFVI